MNCLNGADGMPCLSFWERSSCFRVLYIFVITRHQSLCIPLLERDTECDDKCDESVDKFLVIT